MPQILIRGLSPQMRDAVRDYARAAGLSTGEAAARLIAIGLLSTTGGAKGGHVAAERMTTAQRAERARLAARARWDARARSETPRD